MQVPDNGVILDGRVTFSHDAPLAVPAPRGEPTLSAKLPLLHKRNSRDCEHPGTIGPCPAARTASLGEQLCSASRLLSCLQERG